VPARRTAKRTLDELVAATLLLYPRYVDPLSLLPCPAEVVVDRLAEGRTEGMGGLVVRLRRMQGRVRRSLAAVRSLVAA
jgi:capsular polysaccharide export protein